jgi:hypothetical protein
MHLTNEPTNPARDRIAAKMGLLRHLDRIEATCRRIIDTDHYVIADGVVALDDDGHPVPDPRPALDAWALINEVERQRAQLNGHPSPPV